MKDFRLELDNPPNGVYFTDGKVTGTVIAVNDDQPKDFKAIEVKLVGSAEVQWAVSAGQQSVTYTANEVYVQTLVQVWDRNAAGGGQFPVGTFQFPFSLQLGSGNLPATYNGTCGRINYKVEAKVTMKDGNYIYTRCEAYINVGSVIPINNPQLHTPRAMEISKTLCCLCCASGPINITATVPRTGFCILKDTIPVEVSVENGSSRDVKIIASIHKHVQYTAQGQHTYENLLVGNTVASELVRAHSSTVWCPPPIAVPNIPPTLLNCNLLQVTYYLTVTGSLWGSISPVIKIPITIGNAPLEDAPTDFPSLQQQGATAPPPAVGPPPSSTTPFQPPPPTFAPTAPPASGGFGPPAEFGFGGKQSDFNNFAPVGFSDPT